MLRIIGYDSSIIKKTTCQGCGAVIEYTESDLKKQYSLGYNQKGFDCPGCGYQVIVDKRIDYPGYDHISLMENKQNAKIPK